MFQYHWSISCKIWREEYVGLKKYTQLFGQNTNSKVCLIGCSTVNCCLVHVKCITNVYQILHLHFYKKSNHKTLKMYGANSFEISFRFFSASLCLLLSLRKCMGCIEEYSIELCVVVCNLWRLHCVQRIDVNFLRFLGLFSC